MQAGSNGVMSEMEALNITAMANVIGDASRALSRLGSSNAERSLFSASSPDSAKRHTYPFVHHTRSPASRRFDVR